MTAPPSRNQSALRDAIADFNDRILDYVEDREEPVHSFWADDVEFINFEPSPFPGTYRGHEGVRRWTKDVLGDFTDTSLDVLEVVEEGDCMAVHMKVTGRGRSSGIEGSLEWGTLLTMRDDQCIRAASDITYERTLERLRA